MRSEECRRAARRPPAPSGCARRPAAAAAAAPPAPHQRIDRRGVARLHERPVEHDRHDPAVARAIARRCRRGSAARDRASTARRAAAAPARPILSSQPDQRSRHSAGNCRHCRGRLRRDSATGGGPAQAANGREPRQLGIGLVVAGQQRERDAVRRGRSRPGARRHRANSALPPSSRATTSRARATVSM